MFGGDKIQRVVDAQTKVNLLLLEQHESLSKLLGEVNDRMATKEREHIGFKYAFTALAAAIRFSSDENRDMLAKLLDAAVDSLPKSLRDDAEFCAGINALRDEKTFSRIEG